MRTVEIAEAESNLSNLIDQVERETLAIERNGLPVAFIVSPAEYASARAAKRKALVAALDAVQAEVQAGLNAGKFTQDELEEFVRSLDRKAS